MTQSDRDEAPAFDFLEEDAFDARDYGLEDYLTLGIFWLLALDIFLQFFTRYVLGNSIAWTEEMARYLLVMVGFMGGTMAVRKGSHIAVEFFYRYMPSWMARTASTLVDLVNIAFLAAMVWITFKLAGRTTALMTSVDIPKSYLYYIVMLGFGLMLARAVQVAIRHWRSGTSELLGSQ